MIRKALYLIFFQVLAFAFSSLGAQRDPAVPGLPHLTLDNFSPGIREQIREVYLYSRSHPGDAAASGRLGMVLQTYGLLKEAAVRYRWAGQLARCPPRLDGRSRSFQQGVRAFSELRTCPLRARFSASLARPG